jgi:hypothetical protein
VSLKLALLLTAVAALPSAAQTVPAPCATGPISYIFIDNHSVFNTGDPDLDPRFGWVYRAANALHVRTRENVILRELLFSPGDCYDAYLLAETERILRSYRFLARVDVFGIPQPDGSWHVIVDTQDEWSTRIDLRVSSDDGLAVEGIGLDEVNLLGTGQALDVYYFARDARREYGARYRTPQLLGTRWDADVELAHTRAGTRAALEVGYPFVGEVSRWAGRQSFLRDDRHFDYLLPDQATGTDHVLQPMRESFYDLAVVRRIGRRGAATLIGGGISFHEIGYPGASLYVPRGDYENRTPAPDSLDRELVQQRGEMNSIRVTALFGQRNVWYEQKRGLDSMRGEEDVRLGAEATFALGRSLPQFEVDDDLTATLAVYSGLEIGDALLILRARGDGRRDLRADIGTEEWRDVYAQAELLTYLQTRQLPDHTFLLRLAAGGAWNTVTPFQLTLGGTRGVRGYRRERFPGGRRIIGTIEDRIYFGWPFRDVADVGGTVFLDGGRVWSGDAPFGIESDWRAAAGLGLRVAFPAGSRSIGRIDLAWPIERGVGLGDFRLIVSLGEIIGLSADPTERQLLRSRREAVAGELVTPRF